jgi:hypothetical protein
MMLAPFWCLQGREAKQTKEANDIMEATEETGSHESQ